MGLFRQTILNALLNIDEFEMFLVMIENNNFILNPFVFYTKFKTNT